MNADAVRDWLVDQGYDPARIVVIRNGVDLAASTRRSILTRSGASSGWPPARRS